MQTFEGYPWQNNEISLASLSYQMSNNRISHEFIHLTFLYILFTNVVKITKITSQFVLMVVKSCTILILFYRF